MINKLSEFIDDDARAGVVVNMVKLLQQCCGTAEYAVTYD